MNAELPAEFDHLGHRLFFSHRFILLHVKVVVYAGIPKPVIDVGACDWRNPWSGHPIDSGQFFRSGVVSAKLESADLLTCGSFFKTLLAFVRHV